MSPSLSSAPAPAPAPIARKKTRKNLLHHPLNREFVALFLLVVALAVGPVLNRSFLDIRYLLDVTSLRMEMGLIALTMTFIIVSGNIDLSVASSMALVAAVTSTLYDQRGLPFGASLLIGVLLGAMLGFFNGLLITKLKLPSLSVTLGTFALYRGLTQVLLGDHSVSNFPDWFTQIDKRYIGPTPIPLPLVIFLSLAVVAGLILHRTVLGRWVYAIGTNEEACRYSGIAVDRIKLLIFTASGLMAGIAGLMMTSRLTVARQDLGLGLELDVITSVVLGGTDIFGGRGTIFGTAIALFLITFLKAGMGLANITAEHQLVVIGLLLIFSIVLPNLLQRRTR
jgi:rhamnose transport system permease protein